MSVHVIYYKDRAKMMRPVLTKDEYLTLRNSRKQQNTVKAVREGDTSKKPRLLQMNYSCLPNDDGTLKGSTRMSNSVGMDIDHVPAKEMRRLKKRILQKKDELGLLMMEKSVRGEGYHLVFRRRPELSQEENLKWASELLEVKYDDGAKDITRVFFTTTADKEDLLYLSPSLFENTEAANNSHRGTENTEKKTTSIRTNTNLTNLTNNGEQENSCNSCNSCSEKKDGSCSEKIQSSCSDRIRYIFDACMKECELQPEVLIVEGHRHEAVKSILSIGATQLLKKEEFLAVLSERMPQNWQDENIQQLVNDFYSKYHEPSQKMTQFQRKVFARSMTMQGEITQKEPEPLCTSQFSTLNFQLNTWGERIESLSDKFPLLRDICKGLKRNQYPAAVFVGGGLLMTLMTRCTYRFYHRPEELRRLNSSTLIIGDPASGKSFATRLFKQLAAPIVEADKQGKDAINAYRELMKTKGANKEKPVKPKVVVRVHPARTSNAQFIQDMVNAKEVVDGTEMQLHMLTFDTELDNTVTVQKGGSWIDKQSLELKAFHNEEDGQAYSNVDSILQDFYVTWNYIYTGTPIALKKKVNATNFGSGLATRLTCIPLPATNFEMMEREQTIDFESDERLKEWAYKLDKTKGELPLQKIVDELYDWTARRMLDAKENESKADEMLLKRCAYHALNFSAPFIVMRHWEEMKQEGDFRCGEFETDDVDWQLAELLVNIQYACQKHYFGAMAEQYFDNQTKELAANTRRQQKTIDAYNRLPEEFTSEDVMRCFGLANTNSTSTKISRLMKDHLVEKISENKNNNMTKVIYRKTNVTII